ncbi:MAG: fused MFS/spermidine synthase [Synechococcaceae cyanobacterium SM2_3_1]|nr:fused MFS/spermidine synthase [Synechococcaceae cyanobacterium SM2_3_1]
MEKYKPLASASLLLFFSGLAALIYQTLWVKQLALVVGVDVYAVTIGVSAFFAGLAIGNFWLGHQADRVESPLQLYAGLEFGIAITGISATWALAHADQPFVDLQDQVGIIAWLLPWLLVGLPAIFMGGTFVVLLRTCQPLERKVGETAGILYAANTAGAIVGTLATVFGIVPALGIQRTAWVAAGINGGLALAALGFQRFWSAAPAPPHPSRDIHHAPLALTLYTIAGGLALGYEVIWTQAIVQFLSTRAYAFAIVLATYLLGLTLGSWGYAYWADRIRYPWKVLGLFLAAAGGSAFASVAMLGGWLLVAQYQASQIAYQLTHSLMAMKLVSFSLAAAVFVLLPTLCLGAAYPLAIRLVARTDQIGGDTGLVTALNTIGGIAGSMVTGFVLIPQLGLVHSLAGLAMIAVILGATAFSQEAKGLASAVMTPVAVIGFGVLATLVPADKFAQLLTTQHPGELLFYQESAGATVAVIEQSESNHSFHRLYIQGVSNTGDAMPSLRYMRLQALLPLLIHPGEPQSALVIGLGSGITSGALLSYPDLQKRMVIELLPAVAAASQFFSYNNAVSLDPHITIQTSDGRHQLLRSKEKYDLITLEPPPPSAAGVANLYSRDFYQICKDTLAPEGLLAQWWPLATQNEADSRSLVQSMLDVYPYVSLWTTELHEMLLVASLTPITLNPQKIQTRFSQPTVEAALAEVGIRSPQALLATYVTDQEGLRLYVGAAPPVTDDHPLIEYADWVRAEELIQVLPHVMATHTTIPLGENNHWQSEIEQEQYILWMFYQAGLAAYQGERNRWFRLMTHVLQMDPNNPYYQWFISKSE